MEGGVDPEEERHSNSSTVSTATPIVGVSCLSRAFFTWFDVFVSQGAGPGAGVDGEYNHALTSEEVPPLSEEYQSLSLSAKWQNLHKFMKPTTGTSASNVRKSIKHIILFLSSHRRMAEK